MRKPVCLSLLVAALLAPTAGLRAEEIYRSVDEKGRVIFSDKPADNAKPVEVGPSNTMDQPAPVTGSRKPVATTAATPYALVAITVPVDGATVTDQLGDFTVSYSTQPALRDEDSARLLVDGQPAGTRAPEGVQVRGLPRGEHQLQIQILDPDGRILGQSQKVRILMVRPGGKRRPG